MLLNFGSQPIIIIKFSIEACQWIAYFYKSQKFNDKKSNIF